MAQHRDWVTVQVKRELRDQVDRYLLEHPESPYASIAAFIGHAAAEKLAVLERPSQPAAEPAPSSSTADLPPTRGALSAGRARGGQPAGQGGGGASSSPVERPSAAPRNTEDVELDERKIRRILRARIAYGLPQVTGRTPRDIGIELVKQAASDQGIGLEDVDAARIYERALEKGD